MMAPNATEHSQWFFDENTCAFIAGNVGQIISQLGFDTIPE